VKLGARGGFDHREAEFATDVRDPAPGFGITVGDQEAVELAGGDLCIHRRRLKRGSRE
jgi:hypothetical protein